MVVLFMYSLKVVRDSDIFKNHDWKACEDCILPKVKVAGQETKLGGKWDVCV